jgi:predicted Zn-dependent protease
MRRRSLLGAWMGCGCAAAGLGGCLSSWAQTTEQGAPPVAQARPAIESDEGGLWALMDREEARLRRSEFVLRDAQLRGYITGVMNRLAGPMAGNLRVYVLQQSGFNAVAAPNGMVQLWTGMLLRLDNEAQLATVLGHEIAHFELRHALARLQSARSASGGGLALMMMFGLIGAVGALGLGGSHAAFGRSQESEADLRGLQLMRQAGYDAGQAPLVWEHLKTEMDAGAAAGFDLAKRNAFFATHPGIEDRMAVLKQGSTQPPGAELGAERYRAALAPWLGSLLQDELKRSQYDQSIALFQRLHQQQPQVAVILEALGDAHRLRNGADDPPKAQGHYETALALDAPPATLWRGLGHVHRMLGRPQEAEQAYRRYLAQAPGAPDAGLIQEALKQLTQPSA